MSPYYLLTPTRSCIRAPLEMLKFLRCETITVSFLRCEKISTDCFDPAGVVHSPWPTMKSCPEDGDIPNALSRSAVVLRSAATIDGMLDDAASYAAHKAHFGDPPPK